MSKLRNSKVKSHAAHPDADPHVEGVCHADEPQHQEHPHRLQEVVVEGEVQRRREQDGADQLALRRHETFDNTL